MEAAAAVGLAVAGEQPLDDRITASNVISLPRRQSRRTERTGTKVDGRIVPIGTLVPVASRQSRGLPPDLQRNQVLCALGELVLRVIEHGHEKTNVVQLGTARTTEQEAVHREAA